MHVLIVIAWLLTLDTDHCRKCLLYITVALSLSMAFLCTLSFVCTLAHVCGHLCSWWPICTFAGYYQGVWYVIHKGRAPVLYVLAHKCITHTHQLMGGSTGVAWRQFWTVLSLVSPCVWKVAQAKELWGYWEMFWWLAWSPVAELLASVLPGGLNFDGSSMEVSITVQMLYLFGVWLWQLISLFLCPSIHVYL